MISLYFLSATMMAWWRMTNALLGSFMDVTMTSTFMWHICKCDFVPIRFIKSATSITTITSSFPVSSSLAPWQCQAGTLERSSHDFAHGIGKVHPTRLGGGSECLFGGGNFVDLGRNALEF